MRSGQNSDFGSEARGGDDDKVVNSDTIVADGLREQGKVICDTRSACQMSDPNSGSRGHREECLQVRWPLRHSPKKEPHPLLAQR